MTVLPHPDKACRPVGRAGTAPHFAVARVPGTEVRAAGPATARTAAAAAGSAAAPPFEAPEAAGLVGLEAAGDPGELAARADTARGVALVTGASSGIGAAIARSLAAEERWTLLVSGRDRERVGRVARETGGIPLCFDLAAPDGPRRLVNAAVERTEHVDLLVACAGVGWAGAFSSMPAEDIDRMLTVDLAAVVQMVRLVLPGMLRRRRGHVVLIGSVAGCFGVKGEAVYSAVKAGLGAFADALRYELRGSGVKVTLVVPGVVDTPFLGLRGVPYTRRVPRPIPPERVARVTTRAIRRGRQEVFVPRWFRFPVAVRALAPTAYRRLAARFG
jgi:short-subunit dehydrogenase